MAREGADFGMVVRFTGNGTETIQKYSQHAANGPLSGMVELRDADTTLEELRQAQTTAMMIRMTPFIWRSTTYPGGPMSMS